MGQDRSLTSCVGRDNRQIRRHMGIHLPPHQATRLPCGCPSFSHSKGKISRHCAHHLPRNANAVHSRVCYQFKGSECATTLQQFYKNDTTRLSGSATHSTGHNLPCFQIGWIIGLKS